MNKLKAAAANLAMKNAVRGPRRPKATNRDGVRNGRCRGWLVVQRCVGAGVCGSVVLALVSVSGLAASAPETKAKDALLFRNGDLLYGALESIDPQTGIRWRHPDATAIIDFAPDSVAEIQLPLGSRYDTRSTNACRIRLANSDDLEGNLISVGTEKLALKTWYAGTLEFARTNVEWIVPVPSSPPAIYTGPTGLEDWTMGKVMAPPLESGVWRYKNRAIYATQAASIAPDLKLPATANLQFDLAWKGAPHLAVALYTDYLQPVRLQAKELEPDFGEFYSLMLNFSMADVLVVKKQAPLKYLGQVYVHAFDQKDSAHVEIRSSEAKHTVALLIDGVLIKQWIDPEEFTGHGTAVRFVHQGQGASRLSHLRVTEWDGQVDEAPSRPATLGEDLTRLRNGDRVSGRLEGLRDGKVTINSAATHLAIPWERIKLIAFASTNAQAHATAPGDVRAFFSAGGNVTFHLEKWDTAGVAANSPIFGRAVFDPAAFTRIQFVAPRPPDTAAPH
jgi:hypothetical protein